MYDVVTGSFQGEITMRCQAFSGEGVKSHRIRIMRDYRNDPTSGIVEVWDDCSQHFTSCHILSTQQMARAKAILRGQS